MKLIALPHFLSLKGALSKYMCWLEGVYAWPGESSPVEWYLNAGCNFVTDDFAYVQYKWVRVHRFAHIHRAPGVSLRVSTQEPKSCSCWVAANKKQGKGTSWSKKSRGKKLCICSRNVGDNLHCNSWSYSLCRKDLKFWTKFDVLVKSFRQLSSPIALLWHRFFACVHGIIRRNWYEAYVCIRRQLSEAPWKMNIPKKLPFPPSNSYQDFLLATV